MVTRDEVARVIYDHVWALVRVLGGHHQALTHAKDIRDNGIAPLHKDAQTHYNYWQSVVERIGAIEGVLREDRYE